MMLFTSSTTGLEEGEIPMFEANSPSPAPSPPSDPRYLPACIPEMDPPSCPSPPALPILPALNKPALTVDCLVHPDDVPVPFPSSGVVLTPILHDIPDLDEVKRHFGDVSVRASCSPPASLRSGPLASLDLPVPSTPAALPSVIVEAPSEPDIRSDVHDATGDPALARRSESQPTLDMVVARSAHPHPEKYNQQPHIIQSKRKRLQASESESSSSESESDASASEAEEREKRRTKERKRQRKRRKSADSLFSVSENEDEEGGNASDEDEQKHSDSTMDTSVDSKGSDALNRRIYPSKTIRKKSFPAPKVKARPLVPSYTGTSSRSKGRVDPLAEGTRFATFFEFIRVAGEKLRSDGHDTRVYLERLGAVSGQLGAAVHCVNNEAPHNCGCSVIAHQSLVGSEWQWRITKAQSEHCLDCLSAVMKKSQFTRDREDVQWMEVLSTYQDTDLNRDKIDPSIRVHKSSLSSGDAAFINDSRFVATKAEESSSELEAEDEKGRKPPDSESGKGDGGKKGKMREHVREGGPMRVVARSEAGEKHGARQERMSTSALASASSRDGRPSKRPLMNRPPITLPPRAQEKETKLAENGTDSKSASRTKASTSRVDSPRQFFMSSASSSSSSGMKVGETAPSPSEPTLTAKKPKAKKLRPAWASKGGVGAAGSRESTTHPAQSSPRLLPMPSLPEPPFFQAAAASFSRSGKAPLTSFEIMPQNLKEGREARNTVCPVDNVPPPSTASSAGSVTSPVYRLSTPISTLSLSPLATEVLSFASVTSLGDLIWEGISAQEILPFLVTQRSYMLFGMSALLQLAEGNDGSDGAGLRTSAAGGSAGGSGRMLPGKEVTQLWTASRRLGAALAAVQSQKEPRAS